MHPETDKETGVDPRCCVRVVVKDFDRNNESIPELFRWGQVHIKARNNQPVVEREVERWRGLIRERAMDTVKPVPELIVFVVDSKHQRGNSLLNIYSSAFEAASEAGQVVELGGDEEGERTLTRWTAVVNWRSKQKMAGSVSMPSLPTMQVASASAKAQADHTLGHWVHHLTEPSYACEEPGQQVKAEKSIRLTNMPQDTSAEEVQQWFAQGCGVHPPAVFRDNAAKKRYLLQGMSYSARYPS